jgi:hypothetical protein
MSRGSVPRLLPKGHPSGTAMAASSRACSGPKCGAPFEPERAAQETPDRTSYERGEPEAQPSGSFNGPQSPTWQICHTLCSPSHWQGHIALGVVNEVLTDAIRPAEQAAPGRSRHQDMPARCRDRRAGREVGDQRSAVRTRLAAGGKRIRTIGPALNRRSFRSRSVLGFVALRRRACSIANPASLAFVCSSSLASPRTAIRRRQQRHRALPATSAEESAANNIGIDLIVQRSDRHMLPTS